MFESLELYLERLKLEMKDCDSSLIQDALSDAEEHLRAALDSALQYCSLPQPASSSTSSGF
jgi:hypothetical protein